MQINFVQSFSHHLDLKLQVKQQDFVLGKIYFFALQVTPFSNALENHLNEARYRLKVF